MKIRDSHAVISGSDEEYEMPSCGLDIIAEDGRTMFSISIRDNVLSVDGGMVCKHKGLFWMTGF
jgi:hypothetical protein